MAEYSDNNLITLAQEYRNVARPEGKVRFPEKEEIEALVESHNLEFIGKGSECLVVAAPSSHEVIVALNYDSIKDPVMAKKIFYRHRILSTLFPHNFPRFHKSFGTTEDRPQVSATVRQKINPHPVYTPAVLEELDSQSPYPFSKVKKAISVLKIPVSFDYFYTIEKGSINFVQGEDGGIYYLDRISEPKRLVREYDGWNKDRVLNWMEDHNYSAIDKRIVEKSINRLRDLC